MLALAVGAAAAVWVVRADDLPDDAAFRYKDQVVTKGELDDRLQVLEALYGVQRPENSKAEDEFNRDAAKSMVVSLLLADEAAERDIVVSDKEAQTELDKLIDQQLTGGRDAFVDFLSTSGIAERDVLDEIRAQLATSRLVDDVTSDVPRATEADARQTYDEHRDEMVTPEGRDIVNVVVATRSDADRVQRLAAAGGELGPLVRTWSLDGSTRDTGGKLGVVTEAQLESDYAKVAFAAKKGDVFGPVKTASGWNVGQVVDIVPSRPVTFKDVVDEIRERLTAEDKLTTWRKFLEDVLARGDVEYAAAFMPDDPTAPPAEATSVPSDGSSSEVPSSN
ncbi:hypothetical protein ASE19_06735 [Nocardioides sp. Root79]|nr:hypothetical protein ASE19_06735 [Nocardioides sp. Root79]KRC71125.1 hypothetical protein ASE20_09150 [Nocardioides sp. Root240]